MRRLVMHVSCALWLALQLRLVRPADAAAADTTRRRASSGGSGDCRTADAEDSCFPNVVLSLIHI